jgi:hypothetical protein
MIAPSELPSRGPPVAARHVRGLEGMPGWHWVGYTPAIGAIFKQGVITKNGCNAYNKSKSRFISGHGKESGAVCRSAQSRMSEGTWTPDFLSDLANQAKLQPLVLLCDSIPVVS